MLTLTLSYLTISFWTDGSVRFLLDKDGSGVLAKSTLCGTEATLSFLSGLVCSSFSAETCTILQALRWSGQHQQVCHSSSPPLGLSFCFRHSVLSYIFPFISIFYIFSSLWRIWQELSFLSSSIIRLQWVSDTLFSREMTWLISWPDGERYLCSLQSRLVYLLLSLVSTLVFSRT